MRSLTCPSPGVLVVGLGLLVATLAALDPRLAAGRFVGPLLALAGYGLEHVRTEGRPARLRVALALALALPLVVPQSDARLLGADFPKYFAFLRSLAFDGDLDFANEWEHWRLEPQPLTPTGHRFTQASIGPALFWAPFYALADVTVRTERAFGMVKYAANGYSAPYLRSAFVGTAVFVVLGLFAAGSVVRRRYSQRVTLLAILATLGATPLLYYTFVQPGMPHGLTFALSAFALFLADRIERGAGFAKDWSLLGLALGLAVAVRLQAAVLAVFLLPLLARELGRRRLSWSNLGLASLGGFAGFLPQMLAWKAIYGHYITLNQDLDAWASQAGVKLPVLFRPSSWFDARSFHFWDVLFSAERGFFNWTPLCLVGVLGLVLALRRAPPLAGGGLLAFLATAWFNGSLADYTGSDAFGARRFDLVLPFVALGVAAILEAAGRWPLLTPALVAGGLVLWNVGLMRLYLQGALPSTAPLARVAALQAEQSEDVAGRALELFTPGRGRAIAYMMFQGEYLYWNLPGDGYFEMGAPRLRHLAGGWSAAVNRTGPPQYRTAAFPGACLRFPLMVSAPLRVGIMARRPARIHEQTVALELNGHRSSAQPLPAEWREVEFEFPPEDSRAGENTVCLVFSARGQKHDEEASMAAHVRRVVVRSKTSTQPNPLWGARRKGH